MSARNVSEPAVAAPGAAQPDARVPAPLDLAIGPSARPTAALIRALPLAGLVAAAALIEVAWLALLTLGYWLTHSPSFTQAYLASRPLLWRGTQALLALADASGLTGRAVISEDLLVAMAALAFVVAGLAYLGALVLLDRCAGAQPGSLHVVLAFALLYQATLVLLPGPFSTDLFAYVAYGQLAAAYGLNPYVHPPAALPGPLLLGWIHEMWHQHPTVYGPLWTDLSWGLSWATRGLSLLDQVLAYRLAMNAAHLANLALVWWLLGRLAPDGGTRRARVTAFALFAWNPLLLFEVAGNAHNDGLMLTLLLLSIVPLAARLPERGASQAAGSAVSTGRNATWGWPVALVGLSALVKYTTALVGLFYAVAWARQAPSWRARVLGLGGTGLALLGVGLLLAAPWLQWPEAAQPLLSAATRERSLNSLPDLLALALAEALRTVGWAPLAATVGIDTLARSLTRLLFVVYLAWEARRVWLAAAPAGPAAVAAVLRAATRALLALVLLALTWVLPWYLVWALGPAALLGWQSRLARVTVCFSLTSLPVLYVSQWWGGEPTVGLMLYAVPPLLVALADRTRQRWQAVGLVVLALAGAALVLQSWPGTRPAAYCPAGQQPQFVHGFAQLKARLGDLMGEPLECEHGVAGRGDTRQRTSTGLAYYYRRTNVPTFSRGPEHWALTAAGLVHWTGPSLEPPLGSGDGGESSGSGDEERGGGDRAIRERRIAIERWADRTRNGAPRTAAVRRDALPRARLRAGPLFQPLFRPIFPAIFHPIFPPVFHLQFHPRPPLQYRK